MGKNLKHQFLHAINDNFKESMDKHSMKADGKINDGKIFSFSDRKNLIDVACNFSNYMKENYKEIKMVRDIRAEHIQNFLNKKATGCSSATLKQYESKFNKLEKIINNTYKVNTKFKGFKLPAGRENTKIRNTSMSKNDFKKLENYFESSRSSGKTAIELTARTGLRVSECVKLQGRDIDIKKNIIHVQDGKGGRSRDIPIREKDKDYFVKLKAGVSDFDRICPVRADSINKSVDRAMKNIGIRDKYKDTSIHCIRKMFAQNEFDRCREEGKTIKESLQEVSVLLGHGKDRMELMKHYVLDIK